MRDNRGIDRDVAAIPRKFQEVWDAINGLRNERRAASTEIAGGGILLSGDGVIRSNWPNGDPALLFGPVLETGRQFALYAEDGSGEIFRTLYYAPGGLMPPGSYLSVGTSTQKVLVDVKASTATVAADTQFRVDSPAINLNTPATTGASANAVLSGTFNQLLKSTSSRRYKQDEEVVEIDPAKVLQMVGKSWRDRGEVKKDPDTENRYVGFIAEDLHNLGLTEFVTYDDKGRPDAISYDRLSVALLAVVKDQDQRLTALEASVAALIESAPQATRPTSKRST